MADDVKAKLMDVLRAVALEEIAVNVVESLTQVRQWTDSIQQRDTDIAHEAVFLHRLSINLDRLQHHVARARDVKLAKLRDDEMWTIGQIAKRTSIERTLVQKRVVLGRRAR